MTVEIQQKTHQTNCRSAVRQLLCHKLCHEGPAWNFTFHIGVNKVARPQNLGLQHPPKVPFTPFSELHCWKKTNLKGLLGYTGFSGFFGAISKTCQVEVSKVIQAWHLLNMMRTCGYAMIKTETIRDIYTSWWLQPIWKICSSNWIISPNRDENKNIWNHHLVYSNKPTT